MFKCFSDEEYADKKWEVEEEDQEEDKKPKEDSTWERTTNKKK